MWFFFAEIFALLLVFECIKNRPNFCFLCTILFQKILGFYLRMFSFRSKSFYSFLCLCWIFHSRKYRCLYIVVSYVMEIVVWFSFYLNSTIVCKLQGPPKYIIDTLSTSNESAHSEPFHIRPIYLLDVLWGQPIKLIQVVSTSEFYEYWWNDVVFIFICPLGFLQGLRSKNIK